MKKLIILLGAILTATNGNAQAYWTNNSTTYLYNYPTSSNIGIGFGGTPSQKVEVQNGSIFVNAEGNGFIVDAPTGGGRVGLMKYFGTEGVIGRVANQDFGILRGSSSNITSPGTLTYDFYVSGGGLIGIGPNQTNPQAYLHITTPNSSTSGMILEHNYTSANSYGELIKVNHDQTKALSVIRKNGATETTIFELWGNGNLSTKNVKAESITVTPTAFTWPDYVFKKDYKLMPLKDLEIYINKNSHLPNVPSADEVSKKGVDVYEMNKTLLEKVEEMSLYIIELKKELDEVKSKIK